jgi:hypothetical protein
MINLLPPDVKNGYRYAHRNVGMRRWVVIFVIAFAGLGALVTYGTATMHQSTIHYQKQIKVSTDSLKKQDYDGVQKQVKEISGSFKLAVQVLGKEILFSKMLQQIGTIMPSGSALTEISITQVQGGIALDAKAVDYHTATQIQVNLSDPANKLFSKADIEHVDCFAASADPLYPCKVSIRALFGADNPFLIAGTYYGTNKLLAKQANELTALKAKSRALDKQQEALDIAKKQITEYADLDRITKAVVPQEKNQAAAVREIVDIANAAKITLTDFAFPSSSLGSIGPAAGATAAKPSAAAAAPNSKTADLSQLTPVKDIPGVYQLIISVSNDDKHTVTYDKFIAFLSALEENRHTAQVSTLALTPDVSNPSLFSFQLSIVEYVKP